MTDLEGRGPRRFPINVEAVVGTHEESSLLALTLPTGWQAQLPPNVEATSVFGHYTAEYRQDGRVLRIVRRLVGARGTEPPAKIGDLIAWLKTIGTDDVKYVVLDRGH